MPSASELAVYSGCLERHLYVALRRQVVDLVRLHFLDNPDQVGGIRHVPVVQVHFHTLLMRVLVQVVDTVCIEGGCAALDAVDLVSFL